VSYTGVPEFGEGTRLDCPYRVSLSTSERTLAGFSVPAFANGVSQDKAHKNCKHSVTHDHEDS
jgi:hypothetical protein